MKTLTVPLYNQGGKQVGDQTLSPEIFGVAMRPTVLHEAVIAQLANARHAIADTKTRGEVRGGGKKPWKQKGNGRARSGSTRSPIWVGGGITFGPTAARNFSQKINRKKKNLALRMSLSEKVSDGTLVVLDALEVSAYKTKQVAALLAALPTKTKKRLVVLPARDEKVLVSGRNIPGVHTVNAASLSVVDIIDAGMLITTTAGVAAIEKILGSKKA
jgi:large subunit ribosomal protein L4